MKKAQLKKENVDIILSTNESTCKFYLYLLSNTNEKGLINKSIRKIAEEIRIPCSKLYRSINFLVSNGLLYQCRFENKSALKLLDVGVRNESSNRKAVRPPQLEISKDFVPFGNKEPVSVPQLEISEDALRIYDMFVETLPQSIAKRITEKTKREWLNEIEKCHNLDDFDYEEIYKAVKWAREDSFWANHFSSLKILRQTSKTSTFSYITRFLQQQEQSILSKKQNFKSGREMSATHISYDSDFD